MPLIPGPGRPFDVAALYADICAIERDAPLRRWRGEWFRHMGDHWQAVDDADVRAEVVRWLTDEDTWCVDAEGNRQAWPARDRSVTDVLAMLGDVCHRPSRLEPTRGVFLADCWLDERMDRQPYAPSVWNVTRAAYRWDSTATCPATLAWLADILSLEDIELLRQWCGYLVSGRTDLEKMLVLIGPPRSGKGTLLWMMETLLGPGSTASIAALGTLSSTFGLEPMIGAKLAVMPDVRWNSRDASDAVPEILSITGRDARDIARKNRRAWRGRLSVRFVAASNDTPSLADASGALAGRMLTITMGKSFLGSEDPGLRGMIGAEMPGVLQWALDGLRALTSAGRFVEPETSIQARESVRQETNPVYLFVEDECTFGPFATIPLESLYDMYVAWCKRKGVHTLPEHVLSRSLKNTFRGKIVSTRHRNKESGMQRTWLRGITLLRDPRISQAPMPGHPLAVQDGPVQDVVQDVVQDPYSP